MDFIELAKKRYSCRKYKDKAIEAEKMEYVLNAGRVAPSAKNIQPWHYIVVSERENLDKICDCYKRDWIRSAPSIIIVCGDHDIAWRRPDGKDHTDIDISITIDHMVLAATEQGLGTCWVCNFDVMKCNEILDLPSQIEPIALIPIGYPDDTPKDTERHDKDRRSLFEIKHNEKFTYKVFK